MKIIWLDSIKIYQSVKPYIESLSTIKIYNVKYTEHNRPSKTWFKTFSQVGNVTQSGKIKKYLSENIRKITGNNVSTVLRKTAAEH